MPEPIKYRFVMRRALAATWVTKNDVLLEGEYGFEKDTKKVKIGDGATPWNDLDYMTTGGGGAGGVVIDDVPPASPTPGLEWVDATTGIRYTYYDDGDTQQWVEFGPDTPLYLMPRFPEGSSFPGSPANNDKFYRTDLNLLCYYNSSLGVWLTAQEYQFDSTTQSGIPITANGNVSWIAPPIIAGSIAGAYLTRWDAAARITSANSGNTATHYWICSLTRTTGAGVTTTIASFTTAGDAVASYTPRSIAINAVLDSTAMTLNTAGTKNGTPGNLYLYGTLHYRLIVN